MSSPLYRMTPQQAVEHRRRLLPNLIRDVEAVMVAAQSNPYATIGIAVTVTTDPPHIECDLPTAPFLSLVSFHLAALQRELAGEESGAAAAVAPLPGMNDVAKSLDHFRMSAQIMRAASVVALEDSGRELLERAASQADTVADAFDALVASMEEIASKGLLPNGCPPA